MRTRITLMLLVAGLIGAAAWYAAREPQPAERSVVLDRSLAQEPPGGDKDVGPLLEAGERPKATAPVASPEAGVGEGDLLYTGQVVDTSEAPVAGARVTAKWRGEVLREVTTDEDGAYRFRMSWEEHAPVTGPGVVIARGPKGEVGYGWFHVPQSGTVPAGKLSLERKIHVLVLRPGVSLDVSVSSSCPEGLPASVWVVGIDMGSSEVFARDETDASGQLRLEGLPVGRWRLVASAPGCGRDTALIQLPQPDRKTIELHVPEARRLVLHVREKENQQPIAAARIMVEEYVRLPNMHGRGALVSVPSEYLTDEKGIAVIDGLGTKEKLTLMASAEGFPGSQGRFGRGGQGRLSVKPTETEATIELARPRTIRWPIEDKGHGIPPDGAAIVLKPYVNSGLSNIPQGGIVEKGEIVVEGWAPGFAAALAYVEGFGAARLNAAADEPTGYPTAFYPLRKIELYAKLADGSPAEGVYLMARGPGNNALAPGAKTDAEGYAVLTDLYGGPMARANCSVTEGEQVFGGRALGSVDLHQEDGRFEFTLPTERRLRLKITLDGKPAPAGFTAHAQLAGQHVALKTDAGGICEVGFTPSKSTGELILYLRVSGYVASAPAKGSLDGPDPIELSIDLTQTGSAVIKVLVPKDGRNKITVQAWDEDKGAWAGSVAPNSYNFSMGGGSADANGLITRSDLRAGRYRAVDTYSGKAGAPFDVVAGGEPARTTLDLSHSGWVKGRVVPPSGVPVGEFTVAAEGEKPNTTFRMFGSSGGLPGRPVNKKDGTFWYRVSGDEPVVLRIYHATCVPHPTKGRVTVTEPQEGLELHAEVGSQASLQFAEPLRMRMNPGRKRSVQVRLYPDAVQGEGLALMGTLSGAADRIEFGGFKPGTYTVWVDTITAAPLVLKSVRLGAGDTDLGTHATSQGSTLRIHVHVKEGQSFPRMHLTASRVGDPTYVRHTDAASATIVLSGLGPGRFRVAGGSYAGTGGFNEEILFDGKNDVERTIDLR